MTLAKRNYDQNIGSIEEILTMYSYLVSNKVEAIDASELLRSAVVMTVSALDHYIHQVVKNALLHKFSNASDTTGLDKLSLPLNTVHSLLTNHEPLQRATVLTQALEEILTKDTYQSSKGVEYALNLIQVRQVWSRVNTVMSLTSEAIKRRLDVIVYRRNKIAHEFDIDPLTLVKRPISQDEVRDTVDFISNLVSTLDILVTHKYPI